MRRFSEAEKQTNWGSAAVLNIAGPGLHVPLLAPGGLHEPGPGTGKVALQSHRRPADHAAAPT